MTNSLKNMIGQDRARQMLTLLGRSFKNRGKLPPIGIFGPSGLGKTHLLNSFCDYIGVNQIYINGTAVSNPLAFRAFIKQAAKDSTQHHVIFIDECHNLPRRVQENLLSVLEHPAILCTIAPKDIGNVRCVDGVRYIAKGDVMREQLPENLSFVFATTDPAQLKDTILNRLRKIQLEEYSTADKADIAMNVLSDNDEIRAKITVDICMELANRARSIRQLKNDLCETLVDVYQLYPDYSKEEKMSIMDELLGIDKDGATTQDYDYMDYLVRNEYAGVETLSGVLKTDKKNILMRIEPYLIEKGWVQITTKGRKLTNLGYKKMEADENDVDELAAG